jgi:hypothetical protein
MGDLDARQKQDIERARQALSRDAALRERLRALDEALARNVVERRFGQAPGGLDEEG